MATNRATLPAAARKRATPPEVAGHGDAARETAVKRAQSRGRVAHPEAAEQRRLVAVLRLCGIPFSASLNGVRLPPRLARLAHEQGMEPGDPDVVVWQRPPAFYGANIGMAIELKRPGLRPKTERAHRWSGAEPHQRERLEMLERQGWYCVVAYGCDHALELMRAAGYAVPVQGGG